MSQRWRTIDNHYAIWLGRELSLEPLVPEANELTTWPTAGWFRVIICHWLICLKLDMPGAYKRKGGVPGTIAPLPRNARIASKLTVLLYLLELQLANQKFRQPSRSFLVFIRSRQVGFCYFLLQLWLETPQLNKPPATNQSKSTRIKPICFMINKTLIDLNFFLFFVLWFSTTLIYSFRLKI